jgi:ABC-type dipeptide/oligopeptide/nickel transport system permease component
MKRSEYILKRTSFAIATIFVAITINFVLFRMMPGNYASQIRAPHMTAQAKQALISEFGLDKPMWEQYLLYLKNLTHFNMGTSIVNEQPVWPQLMQALWRTLGMLLLGTTGAIVIGTLTGVIAAWRRGTRTEHATVISALAFYAVPTQWLALMLYVYAAPRLHLPIQGITDVFASYQGWAHVTDVLRHMILPALTLCLTLYGEYTIIVRSSMLETMGEDFILTARAKGFPQRRVVWSHAMRNAMLPMVTMVALSMGYIVAGALLIETVFTYPGIGFMITESVFNSDYWTLQAGFLMLTVSVIFFNFVADLVYFKLDPRITE